MSPEFGHKIALFQRDNKTGSNSLSKILSFNWAYMKNITLNLISTLSAILYNKLFFSSCFNFT